MSTLNKIEVDSVTYDIDAEDVMTVTLDPQTFVNPMVGPFVDNLAERIASGKRVVLKVHFLHEPEDSENWVMNRWFTVSDWFANMERDEVTQEFHLNAAFGTVTTNQTASEGHLPYRLRLMDGLGSVSINFDTSTDAWSLNIYYTNDTFNMVPYDYQATVNSTLQPSDFYWTNELASVDIDNPLDRMWYNNLRHYINTLDDSIEDKKHAYTIQSLNDIDTNAHTIKLSSTDYSVYDNKNIKVDYKYFTLTCDSAWTTTAVSTITTDTYYIPLSTTPQV